MKKFIVIQADCNDAGVHTIHRIEIVFEGETLFSL